MPENPLAVIGERDIVTGFAALGFAVYAPKDQAEARRNMEQLVNAQVAVCLVQDEFYRLLGDEINNYRSQPLPVFVPFSKDSKEDLLAKITADIRLRATGTF